MIVRATRGSLNLTVRVFKCSSAGPFPSTLSVLLIPLSTRGTKWLWKRSSFPPVSTAATCRGLKWVCWKRLKKPLPAEFFTFWKIKNNGCHVQDTTWNRIWSAAVSCSTKHSENAKNMQPCKWIVVHAEIESMFDSLKNIFNREGRYKWIIISYMKVGEYAMKLIITNSSFKFLIT